MALSPLPRRLLRMGGFILLSLLIITLLVALGLWLQLRASLPVLEGKEELEGLRAEVVVERDRLGIPTIRARNRNDVARALGFLHGQDRFFQMDLLRRQPAGELAELFGPPALESDRTLRLHRFRERARRAFESEPEREILTAYAAGVNQGLAALDARPFEYVLLRQMPEPWEPEDSILVLYAMYLELQDEDGSTESSYGVLHDTMPPEMFAFLTSHGTEWDAPIDGSVLALPEIPPAETFSLRGDRTPPAATGQTTESVPAPVGGSNNFAVAGSLTSDGRAILAGDMHLGINVPSIWYRASFVYPEAGGIRRVTGVTLPGTPAMVAGSNGEVAWAFTNSYGDWLDLVVLEETEGGGYLTPDGPRPFTIVEERIRDSDGNVETIEVRETIWGPVIDEDHRGRPRALRWVAHDREGVNQNLLALESAGSVGEAMEIANRIGAPAQNFVVADREGRIGWTIMGPIPRRVGEIDWRIPHSWADGTVGWNGWLEPSEYPRIVAPAGGRIWTANARVVGGEMLAMIGDGGYALGARARQIRDRLLGSDRFDERDLLAIQLDDEALFLARWQSLLLDILDDEAIEGHPGRAELRALVERWGARAAVGSAGFRMVRAFRTFLAEDLFGGITARSREADERFRWEDLAQEEHALWAIVSQRPVHLLAPEHKTWRDQFLATVDRTLAYFSELGGPLGAHSWGERNGSRFRHPLAGSIPWFGRYLEYPERQLPGDSFMPRVQGPTFGASQRMVVAPRLEGRGIFHMPGGQSGHPLSPHFKDAHEAWVEGEPTPFLPGPAIHTLRLLPATEGG